MKDNKVEVAKNKKTKKILCYVGLVFLVILLIMPPLFRKFIKEEEEVEEKIVTIISCEKSGESISSTFLNDAPQNILYKVKGNYTITDTKKEESEETSTGDSNDLLANNELIEEYPDATLEENSIENTVPIDPPLLVILRSYSEITYDESEDITEVRTIVSTLRGTKYYEELFENPSSQNAYFKTLGFTCNQIVN